MLAAIVVVIIIISILLGAIILIQNPKGGGVSATFAGTSQQIFGASKSTDIVEKATWTLAVLLMVLALVSAMFATKTTTTAANPTGKPNTTQSDAAAELEKRSKETGAGATALPPVAPAPAQNAAPASATPAAPQK